MQVFGRNGHVGVADSIPHFSQGTPAGQSVADKRVPTMVDGDFQKRSFPGASQVPMSLRQISLVAGRRRRRILGSRLHAVDHVKERLRRPAEVAGRLAGVGSLLTSPRLGRIDGQGIGAN